MSPSQFNPAFRRDAQAKAAVDKAFDALTTAAHTASVLEYRPSKGLRISAVPALVHDPYSHNMLNSENVAAMAILIQQNYYRLYGKAIKPLSPGESVDLAWMTSGPPTVFITGPNGKTARQLSTLTMPSSKATISYAVPDSGQCADKPSSDDVATDMANVVTQIGAYESNHDVCTLEFGNLITGAKPGPPNLPAPPPFTFGKPSTAEGVFTVSPRLASQVSGAFSASLEAKFALTTFNKDLGPFLDGKAEIDVPAPVAPGSNATPTPITSTITVTGGAFSTNNIFKSTGATKPPSLNYNGKHDKNFTLLTVSQTWPLSVGTVTISMDVSGQADLDYALKGDTTVLYGEVTPSLSATASAAVTWKSIVCIACGDVTSDFTVENSHASHIVGLLARVTYNNTQIFVERLYAHYAPFDYEASVKTKGTVLGFSWHRALFDEPKQVLGKGYTLDTGWQVWVTGASKQ